MNVLSWVLFGIITGLIAHVVSPKSRYEKILPSLVWGMGGATIGGSFASFFSDQPSSLFDLQSFLLAAYGAIGSLLLGSRLKGRGHYEKKR